MIYFIFQSTSPTGEDTPLPQAAQSESGYFNPLPPQGKTRRRTDPVPVDLDISIHFPHRGRHHAPLSLPLRQRISIHFPHRGRHGKLHMHWAFKKKFQSTSPTGEDTLPRPVPPSCEQFQSTSPTGEDTTWCRLIQRLEGISIHFPHRGRHFLSPLHDHDFDISIHFPHRGRHDEYLSECWPDGLFQSTSPTGEDTMNPVLLMTFSLFQSTSPTGEDTCVVV